MTKPSEGSKELTEDSLKEVFDKMGEHTNPTSFPISRAMLDALDNEIKELEER